MFIIFDLLIERYSRHHGREWRYVEGCMNGFWLLTKTFFFQQKKRSNASSNASIILFLILIFYAATSSGLKVVFKLGNKVAGSANVPKQSPPPTTPAPSTHVTKTPSNDKKVSPKVIFKTSVKKKEKRKRESQSPVQDIPSTTTPKRVKQVEKKSDPVFDEGTVITAPKVRFYSLKKVLNTTLKKLIEIDQYNIFYEPITEETAPGYFSVVSKPMDYTTMRSKINDDKYQYYSQFQNDFELMCNNALIYNGSDTVYYSEAKRVLKEGRQVFKTQMAYLKPDLIKPPKPTPHTPAPNVMTSHHQNPLSIPINQDLIVQRILPKDDVNRYKQVTTPSNSLRAQHKPSGLSPYMKKADLEWHKRNIVEQKAMGYTTPNHNVSSLVVQPPQSQAIRSQSKNPIERPYSYALFHDMLPPKLGQTSTYRPSCLRYPVSTNFVNYTKGLSKGDVDHFFKDRNLDTSNATLKGYHYKTIYYPRIASYLDDVKSKDDKKIAKYILPLEKQTHDAVNKMLTSLLQ